MAFPAKRDQVDLGIVTKGASPYYMMNIEIFEGSTLLTTPTVALQNHATQLRIRSWRRSNPRLFLRS